MLIEILNNAVNICNNYEVSWEMYPEMNKRSSRLLFNILKINFSWLSGEITFNRYGLNLIRIMYDLC